MGLGSKIKSLREARGWSQQHLGELAGVEQPTLSAIETRDSSRSVYLVPLARALGLSMEQLRDISLGELLLMVGVAHGAREPSVAYASEPLHTRALRLFLELPRMQQEKFVQQLEAQIESNAVIARHYQSQRARASKQAASDHDSAATPRK